MDSQQLSQLKSAIAQAIEDARQHLHALQQQEYDIKPDVSLGRITRMDSMNAKAVSESEKQKLEQKIFQLQRASARIQHDDDYGYCEQCANQITFQRLLLVPFANYCVECAEK